MDGMSGLLRRTVCGITPLRGAANYTADMRFPRQQLAFAVNRKGKFDSLNERFVRITFVIDLCVALSIC